MRTITPTLSTSQRYFKHERQKACKIALRVTKHYVKPLSPLRWRVSITMYNYVKNEKKGKWYWLNLVSCVNWRQLTDSINISYPCLFSRAPTNRQHQVNNHKACRLNEFWLRIHFLTLYPRNLSLCWMIQSYFLSIRAMNVLRAHAFTGSLFFSFGENIVLGTKWLHQYSLS